MKYNAPIAIKVENYPLEYKPSVSITSIKHGVTEVELSTGQILRLTIHVDGVGLNAGGALDVNYNVVMELMGKPDSPISEIHETVQ